MSTTQKVHIVSLCYKIRFYDAVGGAWPVYAGDGQKILRGYTSKFVAALLVQTWNPVIARAEKEKIFLTYWD